LGAYVQSLRSFPNGLQLQIANVLYLIVTMVLISIGLAGIAVIKLLGVDAK
jgi:hypothetical protein